MERLEILLSKKKIVLLILGSLMFVAIGTTGLLYPGKFLSARITNETFIRISCALAILFFGLTGIHSFRKLFSRELGMVVDANGVWDNSGAAGVGHISWEQITAIKTKRIASNHFILIYVKNPQDYISRATGLRKKVLTANNNLYKTPITVSSSALKIKFSKLEEILLERFNASRNKFQTIS